MAEAPVALGEGFKPATGAVVRDPAATFADQSHLAYLVPAATSAEPEELFQNLEQGQSIFDSLKQRESLFFDETVDILLILKAPYLEEKAFQSQLNRLLLSVEAKVVNGSASGRSTPPGSDTIFAGTVQDVSDPFIVVDEEEGDSDDESTQYVYAVWKLPVFLSRPRMRLQSPSVVFTASAVLKPEAKPELITGGDGYLPSGMPSGFNLLEAFSNDPALDGVKPRLSALRVSRVAPLTRQQDQMQHIRAVQQISFKIHPVIHTRIRFSRPHTSPAAPAIIAILEVDFTPYFECEVNLDKIQLSVSGASIQSLANDAMALPVNCVAHDHLTFLYHINPHDADATGSRDLEVSISASVNVDPGKCTPNLVMAWTATADFTTPVNPGFGTSASSGSIKRAHRPSQLSISSGTGAAVTPLKSPSITQPDALPASTTRPDSGLQDIGITMSFTGPTTPVHVGETFSWAVNVVNRSTEQSGRAPRKFAIVAVPRRRRNEMRSARPLSSSHRARGASTTGSIGGGAGMLTGQPGQDVADAVLDDNVLHAMHKSSLVGATDIVCLSADTRVGPLAPGACHVVDLQFLALKEGLVGIEAIRVVDMATQEHVDIRDLPTMVVQPAVAAAA